jgi:hypothetical protein
MISFTPRFRQKREVWLCLFTKNAKNIPKTHSYKEKAKFNIAQPCFALLAKWGVIKIFECVGEFEEYFQKCWLCCVLYLLVTERSKKKVEKQAMKISWMCTFKLCLTMQSVAHLNFMRQSLEVRLALAPQRPPGHTRIPWTKCTRIPGQVFI